MNKTIDVRNLSQKFGNIQALQDVSFEAHEGEVLGILGHNGAGKTTLLRILSTLETPSSGTVEIKGVDALRNPGRVRNLIGVAGQNNSLDTRLSGQENLEMYARLNGFKKEYAKEAARKYIALFGLQSAKKRPAGTYSGGMLRKLDLGIALLRRPKVLILDEPTVGLDPLVREELWHKIEDLSAAGTTIVLSTQYLEEADTLANRIILLNNGQMVANDSPDALKEKVGNTQLDIKTTSGSEVNTLVNVLNKCLPHPRSILIRPGHTITIPSSPLVKAVEIINYLTESNVIISEFTYRRPMLDDVIKVLSQSEDASVSQ